MPQVSIIIPTFNSAHYVVEAVASAMSQTFRDFEVLVIDDGSTDDTASALQDAAQGAAHEVSGRRNGSHNLRYIHQANAGVSAARNRGIAEARGRYVAFLDADDTWLDNKLERQLKALADHGGRYRASYTAYVTVSADMTSLGVHRPEPDARLAELLTRGNIVGTPSTVVAERSLFPVAGGFDRELSQCADWDMWVRLASLTEFLYVDEPLVRYRQHGGNMSKNVPLLEKDSVRVLEKGFAMANLPAGLRARRRAALARNYTVLAGSYFRAGAYRAWARCALRALSLDVRQVNYMLAYPRRLMVRMAGARGRAA